MFRKSHNITLQYIFSESIYYYIFNVVFFTLISVETLSEWHKIQIIGIQVQKSSKKCMR